jgi:hypothetical protein
MTKFLQHNLPNVQQPGYLLEFMDTRTVINSKLLFFLVKMVALSIPINVHFNKDEGTLLELRNDGHHAVLDLRVAKPIHSLQVHHEYREEEIQIFYLIVDAENVLHIATTHQRGLQVCNI